MDKNYKKEKPSRGFKDTFNFYMIRNLELVGEMEMPYIPKYDGPIPTKLVNCVRKVQNPQHYFVHHYLYDYMFDGKNGIWHGCQESSRKTKSVIKKYAQYQGVISPDFSIYIDLPLAVQIWNIYRDRVTCMWLREQGFHVIFNIRWGDQRTYKYAFYGVERHSVVAVGSHGLIKHPENRAIFLEGFAKMIRTVEPSTILLYGSCLPSIKNMCSDAGINLIIFKSEQTEARERVKDGRRR